MCFENLFAVNFDSKSTFFRKINASVNDFHRLFCETLASFLPDPVCVDSVHLSWDCCCTLYDHCKADIEVIIGMTSPHHAEIVAHLTYSNGTVHSPEMRVCKRNIYALQGQAVMHLAPVCVDHVGCCRHSGELSELCHNFTSGESVFCAAWVFTVSKTFFELWSNLQCFFEAPAAVRIEINSCIRECFFDRLNCFEFFLRCKYAAFKLEIYEAVFFMGRFCKCYDCFWCKGFFVTETVPVAFCIWFFFVRKICFFAVSNVEEVA